MTESMRAAVLVDIGRIELRDVPRRPPGTGEVELRLQATGLCGTDVHIVAGHANYHRDTDGRPIPLSEHPQILGHEIMGVVADVGRDVRGVAVGDRVVVDQGRTCVSEMLAPRCEYCTSGDSHQCEYYREHGITGLPGGFAESVTVPALNAVTLQADIAPEYAVMAEPLGCVLHSVESVARTTARYSADATDAGRRVRTIVIFGGGPAGLLFLQYFRAVSNFDGCVLVSEPDATKRSLAAHFGAIAIDPQATDLVEAVAQQTAGRGAEFVIDAAGAGGVFEQIPGVARKQATVLLYGHGHGGAPLSALNAVQFREPTFISPVGASGGHDHNGTPVTYLRALRLIESGVIDVAPLITHRYHSLDAVPSAFAGDHSKPGYVKGVVLQ